MTRRAQRTTVLVLALLIFASMALIGPTDSIAVHESDNELTFEPVTGSPAPAGSGTGMFEFRGGAEPESRWTTTFQFIGLRPGTDYITVVQGRFGEDGSSEATAFSPICTFRTDADGNGGCWYYMIGLRRLGVVQVRLGDENGPVVLQATRKEDGPGSISSTSNVHSLTLTATPQNDRDDRSASPPATPEIPGSR